LSIVDTDGGGIPGSDDPDADNDGIASRTGRLTRIKHQVPSRV